MQAKMWPGLIMWLALLRELVGLTNGKEKNQITQKRLWQLY